MAGASASSVAANVIEPIVSFPTERFVTVLFGEFDLRAGYIIKFLDRYQNGVRYPIDVTTYLP